MEIAILALGCFWSPEEKFSRLNGVINTEVGYCGGETSSTSYEAVCTGSTNHAEVVKIEFDEKIISYENIIEKFFEMHDPTTLNKQGPDTGTQYRSEIFYINEKQKIIANKIKLKLNKQYNGKIVTNISKEKNYCIAEDYHQKFIQKRS
tara:strand:+ start:163 stop:609 length:447 start_codon:yes stop_codon:yes gene_type:complete